MGVDSCGSQRRIPTSGRAGNGERGILKKDFHMSINLVVYQRAFTFQNMSCFQNTCHDSSCPQIPHCFLWSFPYTCGMRGKNHDRMRI
jgi:hypothetical protein